MLGGIIEIVIGSLLMMLHIIFREIGLITIPLFNQMSGTFLLGFGILLFLASRNLERYRAVPLVNILLRIIMIIFSIIQLPFYPELSIILIPAMIYDLLWSVLVLILLNDIKQISNKDYYRLRN
ncbi:MAG: membrane protein of unknown function [Promethearchaeota archaeon]|nr:MAG: membrane protein of unknown function [Candidatus Lokiarchaeota archaeon]